MKQVKLPSEVEVAIHHAACYVANHAPDDCDRMIEAAVAKFREELYGQLGQPPAPYSFLERVKNFFSRTFAL